MASTYLFPGAAAAAFLPALLGATAGPFFLPPGLGEDVAAVEALVDEVWLGVREMVLAVGGGEGRWSM